MKGKKTASAAAMLLAAALLTGCGQSKEAAEINSYLAENYSAPGQAGYPEPKELADALEGAGFEVERYEEVGGLGIKADRVKAEKGDQYLDICYGVADGQEAQDIMQYYIESYDRCSIINDEGTVFCYSSEDVAKQAGLLAE